LKRRLQAADDFIAKPFTAQVLKDKINQLLAPKARDIGAAEVYLVST
jgi:FixJ family two-component response regulator